MTCLTTGGKASVASAARVPIECSAPIISGSAPLPARLLGLKLCVPGKDVESQMLGFSDVEKS